MKMNDSSNDDSASVVDCLPLLDGLSMMETLEVLRLMSCTQFWHRFLARGRTCAVNARVITTQYNANMASDLELSPRAVFASSDFYDTSIHPTVSDQVVLCRAIAKQLVSDDANQTSRGRRMFEKRVQKSEHWITTAMNDENEEQKQDFHERTISSELPPNLRPLRDPRHVIDVHCLDAKDVATLQDDEHTRDACRHLANALKEKQSNGNGNQNKGKNLFDARVKQSEKWIVSDVVMDAARHKLYGVPFVLNESHPLSSPLLPQTLPTNSSLLPTIPKQQQQQWNFRDFNARAKPYFRPSL